MIPFLYIKKNIICFMMLLSLVGNSGAGTDKFCYINPLKYNDLYAVSACLMDADSGRVLYAKNADEIRPMASTTKIMTLIICLENADLDDEVTFSSLAASEPDVQMNAKAGEKYILEDLLYAMMLESFNDVAMAVAEHVGKILSGDENKILESIDYVNIFMKTCNDKAKELGMTDTYFITPNGLDAEDENGVHSSTATDMAKLSAYCIKNEKFKEIVSTLQYEFSEINGKRKVTVHNKDQFLNQMKGALGIKTGFTGAAGYCFVGALSSDGRTFISVVLGSGWPGNRTYKWKDTKKLMNYGINNYFIKELVDKKEYEITVIKGTKDSVLAMTEEEYSTMISEDDKCSVEVEIEDSLMAPVMVGDTIGCVYVFINDQLEKTINIKALETILMKDFHFYLNTIFSKFLLA